MPDRNKIFDIVPPRKELTIKSQAASKAEKEKYLPPVRPVKKPVFLKKLIPVFLTLILLAGLSSGYFLIPSKAKIEIWPKKDDIEETTTVVASSLQKETSFLPGEILEVEKAVSRNFITQNKKLKSTKAKGTIRVYNNYSTAAQTLVATTRFVSDDGKLFRTPQRVAVPGAHYEGGKLAPGFIDIEVVADQPGQDYNIDASTFSIPGFVGTSKYTAFYAKSSEPMKGGAKEEVFYVSQEDLDLAKEALNKAVLAESDAALRNSISSGKYIVIDGAISFEVTDFHSSFEVGQEAEGFSAQIKARSKTLVFKEEALKDFSRDYIKSKLPSEKKLIERSLKAEYSPEKIDLEKNELTLKLVISAQSYALPEEIEMKETIKNKRIEEVQSYLSALTQIEKAKAEFWPFWVSLAPDDSKSIEIVLRLD